jgi:hypothetical protein
MPNPGMSISATQNVIFVVSIKETGGYDYLVSDIAPFVTLAEIALGATLNAAVLITIIFSSTIHRSVVSSNVYVCCESTLRQWIH